MTENTMDINTIKKWYLQLWAECLEVDAAYQSWKGKRDELKTKLEVLRPVLINQGINIEELEQTIPASTKSEKYTEANKWPDLIYQIIQTQGGPIHYTEILRTLKARGYDVPGKDPRNTILAYLGRHKKLFYKAPEKGRGHYRLRE